MSLTFVVVLIYSQYVSLKNIYFIHFTLIAETHLDQPQVVNKEINELVGKWNDILNTLSEQFVTWDNILRDAEEKAKENE